MADYAARYLGKMREKPRVRGKFMKVHGKVRERCEETLVEISSMSQPVVVLHGTEYFTYDT